MNKLNFENDYNYFSIRLDEIAISQKELIPYLNHLTNNYTTDYLIVREEHSGPRKQCKPTKPHYHILVIDKKKRKRDSISNVMLNSKKWSKTNLIKPHAGRMTRYLKQINFSDPCLYGSTPQDVWNYILAYFCKGAGPALQPEVKHKGFLTPQEIEYYHKLFWNQTNMDMLEKKKSQAFSNKSIVKYIIDTYQDKLQNHNIHYHILAYYHANIQIFPNDELLDRIYNSIYVRLNPKRDEEDQIIAIQELVEKHQKRQAIRNFQFDHNQEQTMLAFKNKNILKNKDTQHLDD